MAAVYQERAVDPVTTSTVGDLRHNRHNNNNNNNNSNNNNNNEFSDDGIFDDERNTTNEVVAVETTRRTTTTTTIPAAGAANANADRYSDADSIGSRSSARRRSKREAVKEKREQRKYDEKDKKVRDKAEKEERKRYEREERDAAKRAKKTSKTTSSTTPQQQLVPQSIEYEAETIVRQRVPDVIDNNPTDQTIYSTGTLGSHASYRPNNSNNNDAEEISLNDTLHSRGSYSLNNGAGVDTMVATSTTPNQRYVLQQQQQQRNNNTSGNYSYDSGDMMQIPVQVERTTKMTTTTTTGGGAGAAANNNNNFVPLTGSATIARMGGRGGEQLLMAPATSSMTATPEPTAGAGHMVVAGSGGTLKRQPSKPIPKSQLAIATVALLSDEDQTYECDKRWNGDQLFEMVCDSLNLEEREYFGLRFKDREDQVPVWLDLEKPIKKQMQKHAVNDDKWEFEFACKFYPPEPNQLLQDLTRYLLCLQVRSDIIEEKLPCSFVTYAILGSYLVQSEIGDYSIHHTPSGEYVAEFAIAPSYVQNAELLAKVSELHKQHRGMSPAEADMHYLDQAKRLAFYGVDLHRAEDSEKQQISLGVNAYGLSVYKEKLRLSRFPWPKILKIAYRRNQFHVKLRQGDFEQSDTSLVYKCLSERATKRLWKVCVDFHIFFRSRMAEDAKNAPYKFPRFGTSKYRFKGRTWDPNNPNQTLMLHPNSNKLRADTLDRMPPSFERQWSRRTGTTSRSVDAAGMLLMNDVGTDAATRRNNLRSISVQGDGPEYKDAGVGGDDVGVGVGVGNDNDEIGDLHRNNNNAYQKIGFSYMDPESLKNARLSQYRGGTGAANGDGGGYDREYDVAAGTAAGAGGDTSAYGYNGTGGGGMYNERTTRMKQTTSTTKTTLVHSLEGGGGVGYGQYGQYGENGEPIIREKATVTSRVVPPLGAGQPLTTTSSHTYGAEIGGAGNRSLLNGGSDTPLSVDTVSSKIRTVETTTYTTDVDGKREMHTTEKVTIMTDGEPIDHDRALAEAIQEATRMNPAMKVEKIEIEEPDND